ncbi:MAG: HAD family hydrolase [Patescibacteria group bacterium]
MSCQTVLFDFDGVLCKGRFYEKTLLPNHPEVYNWIQKNIFRNKEMVHNWMRNQITSVEINELIAENTGIEYKLLNELYEESIRRMELEKEIIYLSESLKLSGNKIGIVTDNMDIFSKITVPNHQLDTLFDVIINSADYGLLKKDENGKLFDIALTFLGEKIENSLMIDDSEKTIELYQRKGGSGFVYRDITELKLFLLGKI